jgi:hypothetical protein
VEPPAPTFSRSTGRGRAASATSTSRAVALAAATSRLHRSRPRNQAVAAATSPSTTAGRRSTAARLLGQTALLTGAAAAYFSVRSVTEGDLSTAVANAERVVGLERTIGLDVEPALQAAVLHVDPLVVLANWVYVFGHWPILVAVLGWLAVRHPARFVELRGAMLLSGAVGMLVFAVLPVAPPRLLDEGEVAVMVDTVLEHSRAYRVLQPPAFTNQYAAVPSLHVGWDLLAGHRHRDDRATALGAGLGALLPCSWCWRWSSPPTTSCSTPWPAPPWRSFHSPSCATGRDGGRRLKPPPSQRRPPIRPTSRPPVQTARTGSSQPELLTRRHPRRGGRRRRSERPSAAHGRPRRTSE